jgi:hypothetical protein
MTLRIFSAIALAFALSANAQQVLPASGKTLPDVLTEMKSDDMHTKVVAFNELMAHVNSEPGSSPKATQSARSANALNKFFARHPDQADAVKLGLIQLLTTENQYFIERKSPPADYHEEDDVSEHYAKLIDAVSSLHDERAIPALTGAITTGGMAQRGLLEYGDKALVPVVEKLKSPDALVRASALGMALALLQKHDDAASNTRIRELLRSSLGDSGSVVRRKAVWEIDCLADRQDFAPVLEKIAKSDPLKLPGKADDGGDGDEFYPVRFDARRVLRHIQNNQPCGP